jgi:cellulose synthase/poly-beta-1,6-N-acetylglucosamine synthase-like glycosyltransferase
VRGVEVHVGLVASYAALALGGLCFIYALKYYASTLIALSLLNPEGRLNDMVIQPGELGLDYAEQPLVSVHLPFYNEANVARRIIDACIDLDYGNYEVLVADDSRDQTLDVLRDPEYRISRPALKFVHRKDRGGFKGGALQQALRYMHPDAEYVVVFDADFVPPPDIISKFLSVFKRAEGRGKPVAAVQGYQLHYLNKNENWLTKGIRTEYSGSYMVERVAEEALGAMKMVSGSVFMLRADALRSLGWTTSITEDWELTLRLYLEGYRVVYTPLIQAAAEIPSTVSRLLRQRMRWAEGHTHAVRHYFWRMILSTRMTLAEKLEFLYFAPYYLQSLFFILGTALWIVSEVYRRRPPFWTPVLGWGLVVSNLLAIPLMGLAGVFLEGDLREDYHGVLSFIAVSYLVAPYQAYAALKGLLEKEEGTWIRTLKTGYITDGFIGLKFRSLVNWLRGLGLTNDGGGHPAWVEVPLPWAPVRMLLVAACVALMALPFVDRIPPLVEALTRLLLSDSVYAAAWRVLIG